MYTGSCLCTGVKYEILGELEAIQLCHCRQCRKAQGTPFVSNIPVAAENFHLISGQDLLREYESTPGKFRVFCSACGSPIISKRRTQPGQLRVRAGNIDQDLPVRPALHIFAAHKANWWEINDELPQFDEFAS